MVWILYSLIVIMLLAPGIHQVWKERDDGKFRIIKTNNSIVLWYNHKGEWLFSGEYSSEEEVEAKLEQYSTRLATRPLIRPE